MAQISLSEFSFGFAFLYERTQDEQGNLVSFPVLPNLRQEAGLGWDVKLPLVGRDVYYQFKLSEYMRRANAHERVNEPNLDGPYFRFSLHSQNYHQQHRLLRQLAMEGKEVFYVAPEVTKLDDFTTAFLNRGVQAVSRLIPLADCDDIDDGDDERHRVLYQEGLDGFVMMSSPRRGKAIFGRDLWNHLAQTKDTWAEIDLGFSQRLLHQVYSCAERTHPTTPIYVQEPQVAPSDARGGGILDDLVKVSRLLHRLGGIQIVIVGSPQQ